MKRLGVGLTRFLCTLLCAAALGRSNGGHRARGRGAAARVDGQARPGAQRARRAGRSSCADLPRRHRAAHAPRHRLDTLPAEVAAQHTGLLERIRAVLRSAGGAESAPWGGAASPHAAQASAMHRQALDIGVTSGFLRKAGERYLPALVRAPRAAGEHETRAAALNVCAAMIFAAQRRAR